MGQETSPRSFRHEWRLAKDILPTRSSLGLPSSRPQVSGTHPVHLGPRASEWRGSGAGRRCVEQGKTPLGCFLRRSWPRLSVCVWVHARACVLAGAGNQVPTFSPPPPTPTASQTLEDVKLRPQERPRARGRLTPLPASSLRIPVLDHQQHPKAGWRQGRRSCLRGRGRSEEHTSELQSR